MGWARFGWRSVMEAFLLGGEERAYISEIGWEKAMLLYALLYQPLYSYLDE
jgi:hypothetical protein